MARSDYTIDSNVELNGAELAGFLGEGEEIEDIEVLGYATITTVGGARALTVPRDWLLNRMEELGLPEFMFPNQPSNKSAFKRACEPHRLIEKEEFQVGGYRVRYSVNRGDNETFHILADVYVPGEEDPETGEQEEGEWRNTTLGLIRFNPEDEEMYTVSRIEEDHPLAEEWGRLSSKALSLFDTLQESHVGYDFQVMTYHLRKSWTQSVPLRDGGAVAFIPFSPRTAKVLESLSTLFAEINESYKDGGRDIEVNTIPVLNTESQRAMVQRRVEDQVRDAIASLYEEVVEGLKDDMPLNEIVDEVEDELSEQEDFAQNYNKLLEMRLDIQEILDEWADSEMEGIEEVVARLTGEAGEVSVRATGGGWYEVSRGARSLKVQGKEAAEEVAEEFEAHGFAAAEEAAQK